jgi:hypothetical protein
MESAHHRLGLNAVAASLASLTLGCATLGGATAFRFLDARQVTDPLDRAGFTTDAVLVHASYPEETDTRRPHVPARRNAA